MTKGGLGKIRGLAIEIKHLQEIVRRMQAERSVDLVHGSADSFPYGPRSFRVYGADMKKIGRQKKRLERTVLALQAEIRRAESWIEAVDDPLLRTVMRLRHIDGLRWGEIAARMGPSMTPDAARMLCGRFLKEKHDALAEKTREHLAAAPELSDRQIARLAGVSRPYVSKVRREMEQAGELPAAGVSMGADGTLYPRR
jgi:hypothetical protein